MSEKKRQYSQSKHDKLVGRLAVLFASTVLTFAIYGAYSLVKVLMVGVRS